LLWISSCYDDDVRTIPADQRLWFDRDIVKSWCFRRGILILDEAIPITKSYHQVVSAPDIPITKSYRHLAGSILLFQYYWRVYFFERKQKNDPPLWMKLRFDRSGPIDSEPATESAEDVERMLLRLLAAFKEPKLADLLDRLGLVPDIPRALFPNYAKLQSGVSESSQRMGRIMEEYMCELRSR